MKTAAVLLTTISACLIGAEAEPPAYVTTFEDSFAPPPPPSALRGNLEYNSHSDNYNVRPEPRRSSLRDHGRHVTPKTMTTAVFPSASRTQVGSASTGYSGPIAIGVLPSSQYGVPSSKYGHPVAIGVSPLSHYGPSASTRKTSSPVFSDGVAKYSTNQYDAHSDPVNYEFAYSVLDVQSGTDFGHQESRQGDAAWGSYTVILPDGRRQVVEYEADHNGYRPRVRYEHATGRNGPY
ncbi:uncharacterized protein LOC142320192 [Lycorma delicatula]|uniref:uncharacterized protein LOC142320192 n=1 Tax=Lycorma delicatula TaxID=130591 RepID=UPI003F50DBBB